MLGITCALYDEAVEIIKLLHREKSGSVYHYTGTLQGIPVSLFLTGPGLKKNSAKLPGWLNELKITSLIQTGYCGALKTRYRPGDICRIGKVSTPGNSRIFEMTAKLHDHEILTVDHPVITLEDRDDLMIKSNADLVDMEAWKICNLVAKAKPGIKMTIIKIVGDVPGEETLLKNEINMRSFFRERNMLPRLKIALKTGFPFFELYARKRMLQKTLKAAILDSIGNLDEKPFG